MHKKLKIMFLSIFLGFLFLQAQQNLNDKSDANKEKTNPSDKIAVAAVGNKIDSEISMNAGRAPFYLIFDENGTFVKAVKNPGQESGRRASLQVVQLLLDESCKTVIAGKFGQKMKNQLKSNNIKYYEDEGTAINVVKTFIKNKRSANEQE
ncbi:MAG: hypothetical protein JXR46_03415 [Calditrichaceae bacterium]|nr:hypothetical protein [Calditrichaceae bacterium]MBN2708072.1 hypothetical protein [Calditrichaceae bacterium]